MQAVIFDFDGTLVDTLDEIVAALNATLLRFELPSIPRKNVKAMVGDGSVALVRRALPTDAHDLVERVHTAYRQEYDRRPPSAAAYPGIDSLLEKLRRLDVPKAIVTNKDEGAANALIHRLFAPHEFAQVRGERTGVPVKPDPAAAIEVATRLNVPPGACAFVGDTSIDMETAKRAGMLPVGVLWGFRDEHELLRSGAALLLRRPEDLLQLFQDKPALPEGLL